MDIKKRLIIISVVGIILLYGYYYYRFPHVPKIKIGAHTFTYETAITPNEMQQGLSGRDTLKKGHGMLFIYNRKEQFSFWMKDMKFPLDIIWIDDTKVVDISENVPPPADNQPLPIYSPKLPVNRVFEVNAGTVEQLNIRPGDTVEYLRK